MHLQIECHLQFHVNLHMDLHMELHLEFRMKLSLQLQMEPDMELHVELHVGLTDRHRLLIFVFIKQSESYHICIWQFPLNFFMLSCPARLF